MRRSGGVGAGFPVYFSIESAVLVDGVPDGPGGAVGFYETVLTLGDVSLPLFAVALNVTGVFVIDGILEAVVSGLIVLLF